MQFSHPRPATPAANVLIDPDLVRKYNKLGPRYTTYPADGRFSDAHDAKAHETALRQRNTSGQPGGNSEALSLYVHIPFCSAICYFCSCNKVVTRDHRRCTRYLRALEREFSLVAGMLNGRHRATQVSLGGGTPTFLSAAELEMLMRELGRHFELLPGEYTVEIDPRTVDDEKIAALAQLGFNYMSLGIQDFDADVQKAVNRIQTEAETARAIAEARRHGFKSINIDLIYGLPRQTAAGFDRTLELVLAMKPDRIALYGYDHLPDLFKSQRHLSRLGIPCAEDKLQLMTLAVNKLTAAGYVYIGMDHFALPHDDLAIAAGRARLQRNLQGYSARPDSDLIAFGISAISKVGATYSQNVTTLDAYYDRLGRAELPVLRGVALTADDLLRRAIIQALMCHFEMSIESIEIAYLINFRDYFSGVWDKIEALERDGLITLEPEWLSVTPRGRLLVRSIAMVFDRQSSHTG